MVGAYTMEGVFIIMAVAVALIIIFCVGAPFGGRLAFGTNPFTTASKGRETVMIEGRIGAEYEC